jgi:hypothetical protein
MHVDELGLPIQADGDKEDQLQRSGMLLVGEILNRRVLNRTGSCKAVTGISAYTLISGIFDNLQVKPGIYVRHKQSDPRTTSGDQLIPVFASIALFGMWWEWFTLTARLLLRAGFAPNYIERGKVKVPDFILVRALPLILRIHWIFYPICYIFDVLLLLAAESAAAHRVWRDGEGFTDRSLDDVDDNNTIITLLTCAHHYSTPLSKLALDIYLTKRPKNKGNTILGYKEPAVGALFWYHRKESGGNPEIAELYKELLQHP